MTANRSVTGSFQVNGTTATTTTLVVSPPQANAGSDVTFTARVSPASGSTMPTGTVTFKNGAMPLAGGTVSLSNGAASLTTSSLGVGVYSVTASYSGDGNYSNSSSPAVALTVVDYTVTPSAPSLTVKRGQSGQVTLTVTPAPSGSFSPTVTFTCSGLPLQSSCTFSPSSVAANGAPANTTLTIQTTASARLEHLFGRSSLFYAFLLPGFMGIVFVRRNGKQIAGSTRLLGLICLLALSTIWSTGCGAGAGTPNSGGNTQTVGTPLGSSVVTITATSSGITKQARVTLTVQ
jgi:Bacterial Ig-like domain (group 3)